MSLLDALEPIYTRLPEVKAPEVQPPLRKKLMWSAIALLLFFIMGNISIIGVSDTSNRLGQLQIILASNIGTLITVGIGPIVLASIILQLLVGGKIIKIDLSNPKDKARFTGMQKLFAIVLCFFEAAVYAMSGMLAPSPGMLAPVIMQVALGSIILLYLDEVVSKYGIGSGIGLFIAGGVCQEILWRAVAIPLTTPKGPVEGVIFVAGRAIGEGQLAAGLIALIPILFTLVIFLIVTFAEGMHINIPITMGRKGTGGRFPVKLLYVSNIPVILAVALFANIRLWAELTSKMTFPVIPEIMKALASFTTIPHGLFLELFYRGIGPEVFGQMANYFIKLEFIAQWNNITALSMGAQIIHAIIYLIILVIVCVVFGRFWIEMGGQGPEAISEQLDKSGMYIPGFRRDPRIIRGILDRYIPTITILGSAFVGLLAGFADLGNALGSGTGILLTVGIVYRLYEELAKQQLLESNPLMKKLFGG
ncbi:MAG: preprotein translocase subunit SecY [Candidatus Diapherotrites archaeon]